MPTEILKPAGFTDSSGRRSNEANAYDGTEGGEDTTYAQGYDERGADLVIIYHSWAAPQHSHTARRLYVRRAASGFSDDTWDLKYSTDGGSSWNDIEAGNQNLAKENTAVITIDSALDLSNLQVAVDYNQTKGPDGSTIELWDIWLEGDYEEVPGYPYHRRTLKGTGPYSGRRGFDEITGHRRGFWP